MPRTHTVLLAALAVTLSTSLSASPCSLGVLDCSFAAFDRQIAEERVSWQTLAGHPPTPWVLGAEQETEALANGRSRSILTFWSGACDDSKSKASERNICCVRICWPGLIV
jgi:hypothetical protein